MNSSAYWTVCKYLLSGKSLEGRINSWKHDTINKIYALHILSLGRTRVSHGLHSARACVCVRSSGELATLTALILPNAIRIAKRITWNIIFTNSHDCFSNRLWTWHATTMTRFLIYEFECRVELSGYHTHWCLWVSLMFVQRSCDSRSGKSQW